MGAINSLHMATLRELDDPLSNQVNSGADAADKSRPPKVDDQYRVAVAQDRPDTHGLRRGLGADPLSGPHARPRIRQILEGNEPGLAAAAAHPQENLAELRQYFDDEPAKLDKKLDEYIRKLSLKKGYDPLPFYTVIFAQPLGNGMLRRAAMVSQSPQMIQQWVQDMTAPHGAEPNWEAVPRSTRARAILAAEEWMRGS